MRRVLVGFLIVGVLLYIGASPFSTLVITDWGPEHLESYYEDKEQYTTIVYDFLAEAAPDFGVR